MNFFNCNRKPDNSRKKPASKTVRNGVALSIAFGAFLPSIIGLLSNDNDGAGFWPWLLNHDSDNYKEITFINKENETRLVDLKGSWRFATGDDLARAQTNFDDSSWRTISVPSYWEDDGYRNYNGFAWYRNDFNLESADLSRPLFVSLGKIDDVDEVYINGKKIGGQGQLPPHYFSAWNQDRIYRIPEGLLNSENNVISVRVFDTEMGGGIIGNKIGIYASHLPQPLIDLSGSWKFKTGDDPKWKNETVDDSDFQDVSVPMAWDHFGHEHYDGHGWYRKIFDQLSIPENETLILFCGKIDDTDEVFLNGERIGKTGNLDNFDIDVNSDYYRILRQYEFSSSLLKDKNILAVRVHDSIGFGGIYDGPVAIMKKSDFLAYQKQIEESQEWHLQDSIDWLLGRH